MNNNMTYLSYGEWHTLSTTMASFYHQKKVAYDTVYNYGHQDQIIRQHTAIDKKIFNTIQHFKKD